MSSSKESMVNIPAQYGAVISSNTIEENESTNFFARPSLDQMTFKGKRTSAALLGGVLAVSGCAAWFGHAGTHLQQSVGSSYSSLGSTTSSSGFTSFNGQRTIPANFIATKPNLVYIKIPKTGSTTMAFIARKIAIQHGLSNAYSRGWITSEPGVWWNHEEYHDLAKGGKISSLQKPTFSWTTLRNPVDRVISQFQYEVMYNGKNSDDPHGVYASCKAAGTRRACQLERSEIPSDYDGITKLLIEYVEDNKLTELGYSSVDGMGADAASLPSNVNLDFVGITERFTESILIMGELLGLSFSDMLYQSAKSAEYDWGGPKELSTSKYNEVKTLMKDSPDWAYIDIANKKMDEYVGQIQNYSSKLNEYEYHLAIAQEKCPFADVFLITDDDFKCNQSCFDDYANSIHLKSWGDDAAAELFQPPDFTSAVLPVESSGTQSNRFEIE